MIRYRKTYCGFSLLFRIAGTAWPYGILPGLLSCGLSIGLSFWDAADVEIRDRSEFISHPYAFQLFAYLLGFLMVFRTNFAYQRYWEAMGMVQAMGAKWLDGALMGICFDAAGKNDTPLLEGMMEANSCLDHEKTKAKGGPTHSVYAADLVHLTSLLHALALQHFRGDGNLNNLISEKDLSGTIPKGSLQDADEGDGVVKTTSFSAKINEQIGIGTFDHNSLRKKYATQRLAVLGGISAGERRTMELDSRGNEHSTEARVAMVEGWFMRRLLARQKFEQGESATTSPPILSRLYQVVSDGALWFSHASKIAITPFPFPYHNLISIFLWTYTFMVPVLVNGIIKEDVARAVISFNAVFVYHSLAAVGDNLEDPFCPYDQNELPLQELQDSVNQRLLAFGVVPQRPAIEPPTPSASEPFLVPKPATEMVPKPAIAESKEQQPVDKGGVTVMDKDKGAVVKV